MNFTAGAETDQESVKEFDRLMLMLKLNRIGDCYRVNRRNLKREKTPGSLAKNRPTLTVKINVSRDQPFRRSHGLIATFVGDAERSVLSTASGL